MESEFYTVNPDGCEELAKRVVTARCKNLEQVYTLHGEKTESKKKLNYYTDSFDEQQMYSKAGTTVVITGKMDQSYYLNGLNRNIVIFKTKIKHVMVRLCEDTRIFLNGGTVVGIDIMHGSNISLRTPKHNFTNVENSSFAKLNGDVDSDSLIHVTKSMDVFVNHKNLMVNPFHTKPLKMVFHSSNNEERLDIGELSISPTAESTLERWSSKLMLMGNNSQ